MDYKLSKGISPNVINVKVDCTRQKEHWFLLRSDAHHDNPHCDQALEKKHLDEALEYDAGILDNGDLHCVMGGKYDKRSNKEGVRPEHQKGDYFDSIIRSAADFYQPYAKNWIMFGHGNHETAILKNHETDLTERLAQTLRDRTGAPCLITGYSGWVRFSLNDNGRQTGVTLWHHHGYGGGGPVTSDTIQAQRQRAYVDGADVMWSGHCFSQDTEVLTPTGWKSQDQLVIGSEVATMNKLTKRLEFQPVSMVHRHYGYSELLNIKADGTDLLVTPDHGLVYEKLHCKDVRECTAREFMHLSRVTLPSAALYDGPPALFTDEEIRLVGTIVADGNISEGIIRFHFKKDRKIQRLKNLLEAMGLSYTVGQESAAGSFKINIPADESRFLRARFGLDTEDKRLPDWLYGLNRAQSLVLLEEYKSTDGCSNGGRGMVLYSIDKRNLDVLQTCAVKCGYRTSLRTNRDGQSRLNVAIRSGIYFAKGRAVVKPHDGSMVWCVTVPNGTVIVRRNGCVTVTQNTHDQYIKCDTKIFLSQEGEVKSRNVWYVKSPTYKNEYDTGQAGWWIETGKIPKPLGAWWMKLSMQRTREGKVDKVRPLVELTPAN